MKILVCIKQVYNSEFIEEIDDENNCIISGQNTEYRMNRFDEYALEEALLLKDIRKEVSIDVITVGAKKGRDVIKRALGMGADRGIHIIAEPENGFDPVVTASLIAKEAAKQHFDLILTGVMSEDMMHGQTGQMLAEMLNIPSASSVVKLALEPAKAYVYAERELESGVREKVEASLPALFTIQGGINTPRYPTLSNILNADAKEIVEIKADSGNSQIAVLSLRRPEKVRNGLYLSGTSTEKAELLYRILKEKNALQDESGK